MLLASQFPNTVSCSHTGNFNRLSTNYNELFDLRPGKPCLFTQTVAGSQTLTIVRNLANDTALDINTVNYPYVIVGVMGIGNADFEGQLLPSCSFTLNGKWGAPGAKVVQAAVMPTGLAFAAAIFKASEKSGATATTQATVAMTTDFRTSFGNFGVGEFFVIGCDEFPINQLSEPIINANGVQRSSNAVPNFVLRDFLRQLSVQFVPLQRGAAKGTPTLPGSGRSVRAALMAAMRNGACFVAAEWRNPGTAGPDYPTLLANGFLANLMTPNPALSFTATDGSGMYRGSAAFEELS